VWRTNGKPRYRNAGDCEFHTQHAHFHYLNFVEYTLHRVNGDGSTGKQVAESLKESFCLADDDYFGFGMAGPNGPRNYVGQPDCNLPAHVDPSAITVDAGQAARIMTGAAVPAGADAVVMIEETDGGPNGRVEIRRRVGPGDFVRGIGDDVHAGDVVVRAGDVLTPARVALLSGVGRIDVSVVRRPRVGVISTGDELAPPGTALRHGQIRDSNRALLTGLLAASGIEAVDLGSVIDDRDVIAKALRDATDTCDAVLTSGGVSVGDFDYLAPVLDELGQQWTFRLAIKPAKPFVFGLVGSVPVFALPGNPVSAAVSFELLARPALRRMAGFTDDALDRPRITAVVDEALRRRPDGKTHYVRVAASWRDDGRVHVRSAGGQGSHMLSSLGAANALAVLPDGDGVDVGADVEVLLLDLPD